MASVTATLQNGNLTFIHDDNYESRGKSVETLIRKTVLKFNVTKNFKFTVYTGDNSKGKYSFCTEKKNWNETFPCYLFDSWPECGVFDYTETINSFKLTAPSTSKVGWIGAPLNRYRVNFLQKYGNTNFSEGIANNWNRSDPSNLWKNTKTFMTYQDQIDRWKYLLDIEGCGFSARLKMLLNSGRIVFITERPYEEFFFEHLTPWVTHVPVKRDYSDLAENFLKIESDVELQRFILKNQKDFCQKYLSLDNVLAKIHSIILENLN